MNGQVIFADAKTTAQIQRQIFEELKKVPKQMANSLKSIDFKMEFERRIRGDKA